MLHRLEGVSDQRINQKPRGKRMSGESRKKEFNAPFPPVVKKEPKLKEKLFSDKPIIDDDNEEEPDEEELKRRKPKWMSTSESSVRALETNNFPNAKFKVARDSTVSATSLPLLTCLVSTQMTEVVAVLRKKPTTILKESPKDFEKLKQGKIYSKEWYVVYQARDQTDADYRRGCFFLSEKHLFTTKFLEHILDMVK
ncbi:unnamed protein product [Lactuca saligna]|uniref:Uncharacterized protein n=1 Tax=Lactuca saligna TaxID=75948 RepID=A0AA35ZVE1_LACSI|nr:unnamed protein product [Lactuca saligna]